MKKAIIITNSGMGLYSFRKELLEELKAEGYHVVLAYPDGKYHREFSQMGCRCIRFPFDSASLNPLKDARMFLDCMGILGNVKPDIALLYTIKPCIYGGLACAFHAVPCIATVTGVSRVLLTDRKAMSAIAAVLCRIGYSRAKAVFFQNKDNEELFWEKRIARGKHILVRGSGVNLMMHPYKEHAREDGKIKLLYLGRFLKVKGMEELASGVRKAQAENPGIVCKIVGEQCDRLPLLEEAVKDGIIEQHGPVNDVNPYLEWCDALLMPSYAEGMSNVMQEAAATGRPSLASNVPGCREIVDDGKTGLLFEPGSGEAVYRAIMRFAALSYRERKQMGVRARKKMEKEFDRAEVTARYMQAVNQFAGKGKD